MPSLSSWRLHVARACVRNEKGAVALLVAVSMVFLVLSAALILDFGMVRIDRQENKSGADAAALAGVDALVLDELAPTDFRPFRGVCQAKRYVQANLKEFSTISGSSWTDGNGAGVAADGCTSTMADQKCVKNSPGSWAQFTGSSADGRLHIRIQSGYLVSDGGFSEEQLPALQADPGVAMYGGCDQLAVIISETRQPTLGAIAVGDVASTVRSVGRVNITVPRSPVALLILEQQDCGALIVNGSGDDTYVRVKKSMDTAGNEAPGRIHMDSNGKGDGCNSKQIISTGTNHTDAVKAFASADSPGIIEVVAAGTEKSGLAADPFPNVNPEGGSVTGGEVLTRAPVDTTYLDGIRDEFTPTMPWDSIPGTVSGEDAIVTNCKNADAEVLAAQAKTGTIYFNCPANGAKAGSLSYGADLTFQANKVVVKESIGMSGGRLAFPNATEIYVKGASTGISVKGTLAVGSDGAACSNASTGAAYRKVIVGSGGLTMNDTGSQVRFCDTTVIMGSGQPNGCVPSAPGTYIDDGKVCPAAGGSTGTGVMNITGGNVDWVAPNMHYHTAVPETQKADAYRAHHEDLAFWSETSGTHTLRASASGTMSLTGVFMVPNADQFDLGGNGNQFVSNSQYVVKKFNVHGGARLDMAPDPNDTVTPPQLGFSLVR